MVCFGLLLVGVISIHIASLVVYSHLVTGDPFLAGLVFVVVSGVGPLAYLIRLCNKGR